MTTAIIKTPIDWTKSPRMRDEATYDMHEGCSEINVHAVDRVIRSLIVVVDVIVAMLMIVKMACCVIMLVIVIMFIIMILLVTLIMTMVMSMW